MNTQPLGIIGWVLVLVGFTDNIWSWLTPLSQLGAFFDSLLVLAGAFLAFDGNNFRFKVNPMSMIGILLIIVGFTDNQFSWLTSLNATGAAFDSMIVLVGGFFAFAHNNLGSGQARGH